jgi:hypothetical protein
MENLHEQREFKIVGYANLNDKDSLVNPKGNQDILFKYDKWTKGKVIAFTLSNGLINEPNIDIYIDHNELVGLLRFILNDKKDITINVNHLINKLVVVSPMPNSNNTEIQEQIVTSIQNIISNTEIPNN